MNAIETFRWWIFGADGLSRLTAYHLSRAEAARLFPGATPDAATRALRQVGGTDPPTLEDNLLRSALLRLRCEAAGAQARFAGVRRASNPFARATAPEPITWLTPAARAELAAAWWRGWDGTG